MLFIVSDSDKTHTIRAWRAPFPFGHSSLRSHDFKQFALFDGAEFDPGAAGGWVVVETDFPEELGVAVRPCASYVMIMVALAFSGATVLYPGAVVDVDVPSQPPKLRSAVHCRPVPLRKRPEVKTPVLSPTGYQAISIKMGMNVSQAVNSQSIRFPHKCGRDANGSHGHTVIKFPLEQRESFGVSISRVMEIYIEILYALKELTPPGRFFILSQGDIIGAGSGASGLHVKAVEFF